MIRPTPFRRQLFWIALAFLLPIFAVLTYQTVRGAQEQLASVHRANVDLAAAAAARYQHFLAYSERDLRELTQYLAEQAPNTATCNLLLPAVRGPLSRYVGMALSNVDGGVVCTSYPAGSLQEAAILPLLLAHEAENAPGFHVSEPVGQTLDGLSVLPLSYPLQNENGELLGRLALMAPLDYLQSLLKGLPLREGRSLSLVSVEGALLARLPPGPDPSGLRPGAASASLTPQRGQAPDESLDPGGTTQLRDSVPVPGSTWVVQAGVPRATAFAAVYRQAGQHLLVFLVAAASLCFFLAMVRRFLSQSAAAIAEAEESGGGKQLTLRGPLELQTAMSRPDQQINAEHAESQRLRRALRAANVGLWDWDLSTNRVQFSREWKRQIGYEEHEIADDFSEWQSRVHPDDLERAVATVQAFVKRPWPNYQMEFRFRHRDGSYRWILTQADMQQDEQGRPQHMLGAHVDITPVKEAEARLREREQQLRVFVEHAPAAIAMLDRDMRYLQISRRWAWDFRLQGKDVIGLSHYELFPNQPERWKEVFRRSLAGAVEMSDAEAITHLDGSVDWLRWEVRPWHRVDGDIGGLLMFSETITERKQMELALVQSEKRLRDLIDGVGPEMFVGLLTPEGVLLEANRPALEAADLQLEDVVGKPVEEAYWFSYSDSAQQRLRDAIEAAAMGRSSRFDIQIRVADEVLAWLDFSIQPLRDESGKVVYLIPSAIVVDERKRAEDEVRQLNADLERRVVKRTAQLEEEKLRAENADRVKSVFLAAMSHELRTPLNSIIGFTGILLQELAGPLNPEQNKQLGMVRGSARHLLALINDILDISKIEAGELKVELGPVDLPATIRKVAESLAPEAERKGLALHVRIDHALGEMESDERRLEQILLNLLNNAIKFTDTGDVSIDAAPDGAGRVAIAVRDTGIGIREENLKDLFQPFHQVESGTTRQYEGTGLGLAISRRLADRLGGEVRVESQWQAGSTFTLVLPLERPAS